MKQLSIILPIYNEKPALAELIQRIERVVKKLGFWRSFEIIAIDDGSTDGSYQELKRLKKKRPFLRIFSLVRNFGKEVVYPLGFAKAKGEVIITMDADLQERPEDILKFLKEIKKGADVVIGWKKARQDTLVIKIASSLVNLLIGYVTGLLIHDTDCGFRALKAKTVKTLNIYGTMYRFIPHLAHAQGFRVKEIPIGHRKRPYGRSKYSFFKKFFGVFDLLTIFFLNKFLDKPMHFFGLIGLVFLLIGGGITTYLIILRLLHLTVLSQRPLFLVGIFLIIVSIQIFSIGFLSEAVNFHLSRFLQKQDLDIVVKEADD